MFVYNCLTKEQSPKLFKEKMEQWDQQMYDNFGHLKDHRTAQQRFFDMLKENGVSIEQAHVIIKKELQRRKESANEEDEGNEASG